MLLGAADGLVGSAELLSGVDALLFAPELAPEALATVAGCPAMETLCPTWLARSALPVSVYTVPV